MIDSIFKQHRTILILGLLMAFCRLIPAPEFRMINFTALGATALFFGVYINDKKQAISASILLAMFGDLMLLLIQDINLDFMSVATYLALALIALMGNFVGKLQRGYASVVLIMVAPLLSSVLHFMFILIAQYLKAGGTFISALQMAIPQYKGLVLGDIFFTILLFSIYAITKKISPVDDNAQ
ncbi:MAG: hypothetical protein JNK61_05390 [Bacteroidia bacterium]|nr:hypothetical protein [Bacteroidia bacterium]